MAFIYLSVYLRRSYELDLLIKFPRSSILNAAIYFRYSFSASRSVCILLGNRLQGIKLALKHTYPTESSTNTQKNHSLDSPFQGLNVMVSEYVAMMETERLTLDNRVRELEAKTGMSAHIYEDSQKAAAAEYNDLLKNLHICEGLLALFERITQFQVGWMEWLQVQHTLLTELRFRTSEIRKIAPAKRQAEEFVQSSLELCSSMSRERLEQVRTLRNRIRIQLSVVNILVDILNQRKADSNNPKPRSQI